MAWWQTKNRSEGEEKIRCGSKKTCPEYSYPPNRCPHPATPPKPSPPSKYEPKIP